MKIKFKVDPDRLTVDDLIALEEKTSTMRSMRDLLARFVLDGDGQYAADEAARSQVGQLTLTELRETIDLFAAQMKVLQEQAVPNATGNGSS